MNPRIFMKSKASGGFACLLSVLLVVYVCLAKGKKSLTMDPVNMKDWNLPDDEQYSSTYQLSNENFKKKVLQSRDPWIVVIHKGKLHGKWKRHADYLKGSIWYGVIDYEKEKDLAEIWADDLTEERLKLGVGLVFPYGKTKKENLEAEKHQWPRHVFEPKKAEEILKSSIPDRIKKFSFAEDDMENFQSWILNAYYHSQPPKYPVICVTDEPEPNVPVSLLAISNYFDTFFSFGLVRKKDVEKMIFHLKKVPPPEEFPHYLLLIGKEPSHDEIADGNFGMTFNIFPFNHKKYGAAGYFQSVVKYLYTANEDYREELPGRRSDESIDIKTMSSVTKSLNNRLKLVSKKYKPKSHKKYKTEL